MHADLFCSASVLCSLTITGITLLSGRFHWNRRKNGFKQLGTLGPIFRCSWDGGSSGIGVDSGGRPGTRPQ